MIQLLRAAKAFKAAGEAIEDYVEQIEKDGFNFDIAGTVALDVAAKTAFWLADRRSKEILDGGD
jgi:hypothetical protein